MSIFEKLNRSQLIGLSIALAIVLFLAANIIVSNGLRSVRVDLTDNNLFSLSSGTRTLLANLDEPIHMRLFLSKGLIQTAPQLASYANRVQSVLESYERLSRGKISLEVIDPQPFSNEEDRAVGLGINRIRLSGAGDELFFGLAATNSTDGSGRIPVFSPDRETFLEYDLTRLVAELGQREKPIVALLDGLGVRGDFKQRLPEQHVLRQLKEFFQVVPIEGDVDRLPDGTRVVMLVHPQALSERTLFTIDQWVLNGGATMVFVDPYAETKPGQQPGRPPLQPGSDLKILLDAWGVGFDKSKTIGDPANALRTTRQADGRTIDVANYPWFAVRREGMDTSDAVLAQLSSIVITTAGSLVATGKDTKLTPLLSTSPEAGLLPTNIAAAPFSDPRKLLPQIKSTGKPLVVAGRLSGKLKSAFPDGKPKESKWEGDAVKEIKGEANVIVVGDADMLMDRNWVQARQVFGQTVPEAFANNGPFVINAVEQMAGGAALASLRGRGVSWRPFEKIAQLEKAAEAKFLAKEQRLVKKLQDTEAKLLELKGKDGQQSEIVSTESSNAVEQFRQQLLSTRAELREVQFELRRDVESLKAWLTTLNVGLLPALVAGCALAFALRRPRKQLPKRSNADDNEETS